MEVAPPPARTHDRRAARPARQAAPACQEPAREAVLPPAPADGPRTGYDAVKRVLDCAAAVLIFAAALPVTSACWLLVRLTSRGPGIYSQVRVGRGGRHFRIYKLRTMYHDCEATCGGVKWSTKGDTRVTPVGRVLRKLHLDELPQLWNVFVGDMSLVGPRPERPELIPMLAEHVPGYRDRLLVRPGVTGLAQIQLPADTDVDSVRRKVALDRCYVERYGFGLDARLVIGTAFYLAGLSYAKLRRVFGLPDPLADGAHGSSCPDAAAGRPLRGDGRR